VIPRDPAAPMSFWEHLGELRVRLLRAGVWIVLASAAAYVYRDRIYEALLLPLQQAAPGTELNFFSPAEPFFVYLRIAIYTGLLIGVPALLWELWGFVAPALTATERRTVRPLLPLVLLLFVGGALFVYTMLLPGSLAVLLGIAPASMEAELSQERYFNFILGLCLAGGVLFELPLVLGVLGMLGVVSARWLWTRSAHAFVVLMILAAVITPTGDAFTMLALTLPLMGLYLASIVLVWAIQRRRPAPASP
jgi:sec-independent protein translocase protein TatC